MRRLAMQRNVVNLRANAARRGFGHGLVPGRANRPDIDCYNVEMVRRAAAELLTRLQRAQMRKLRKGFVIEARQRASAVNKAFDSAELRCSERGLEVGHPVIES